MKIIRFKPFLAGLLVAAIALPAAAQTALEPNEAFRGELLQYVRDLRTVPSPMMTRINEENLSLDEAEASIQRLTAEELMTLQESMSRVPFWRELPAALRVAAADTETGSPRDVAMQLGIAGGQHEAVRAQLRSLVSAMRAIPAPLAGDGYTERVDRIEAAINGASDEEITQLSVGLRERLPALQSRLESRTLSATASDRTVGALANCGSTFPGSVLCEIENVFNQIAAIPAVVSQFAEDAISTIENGIKSLFSTLQEALPTAQQIISSTGLDDPDWWSDMGSTIANVAATAPLCPAPGTNIPGIGTVGDIRATVTCRRGVEWVSSALYDLAPDDIWGLSLKTPFAFLYYPINYLCECYQGASDDAFDVAQAEHRDLVEERLNVTVSSRSSQISINNANTATASLDDDVAAVETKLDLIETKTDNILINAGDMSDFLVEFRDQALRLRIEADLFREANTKIVLFQMPERVGGHLELARGIVDETIARRASNGGNMNSASRWLSDGDAAYASGKFKTAYDMYRKAYREATR